MIEGFPRGYEGFPRGYEGFLHSDEDRYYNRSQYGRYSNGTVQILGAVLGRNLNLTLFN